MVLAQQHMVLGTGSREAEMQISPSLSILLSRPSFDLQQWLVYTKMTMPFLLSLSLFLWHMPIPEAQQQEEQKGQWTKSHHLDAHMPFKHSSAPPAPGTRTPCLHHPPPQALL